MTASISIATRKPRSKRTAKVLILTGADGKYARHDGRHDTYVHDLTRRPAVHDDTAIAESLDSDPYDYEREHYWPLGDNSFSSVHSTESPGFACPVLTSRRRARNARRRAQAKAPIVKDTTYGSLDYDEAGRPVVYKTDDAWSHRCFR